MGLYNGENTVDQLSFDLHKADREFVLKRTAITYVLYSIPTGVGLNRGHHIEGSHPLSKHAFSEIVKTTLIVHRRT